MSSNILIVDDHKIVREGLKNLLLRKFKIEKIKEAQDGLGALELVKKDFFKFIIMDISMPNLNGIDATKEIMSFSPESKIIILSMHSDKNYVFESLKAGAKGFLLKDCAFEELLIALKTISEGRIFLSAKINDVVVSEFLNRNAPIEKGRSAFQLLTTREREVLQLLTEGHSTKEMAAKLDVSVKTIENHRQQLMEKLDIHSIAELTKYAIREGLTQL